LRPPRDEAAGVFSEYLRSLDAGREPDPERLRGVLAALETLLRQEMRRSGIWRLPPVRLGVIGYASWSEPGALAELAADAYEAAILRRLRGLLAQLRLKPQIEGLVRLNVRRFLRDYQREGDPLGYRAWVVAQNAAERAVGRGALAIAADGPPVAAGTLLATAPPAGARGGSPPSTAGGRRALAERAARWNAELLPELVTAGGRGLDAVIDRLAERLPELAADGVAAFRVRDLVAALRDDLRRRWAARLWQAGDLAAAGEVTAAGENEPPVPVLLLSPRSASPEEVAAEREAARRLRRCMEEGLEAAAGDPRTLEEARALWRTLEIAAVEEETMPSRRRLAEALGIPRDRMPELFRVVGRVMTSCRRALGLDRAAEEGR
jgi:hypothetical protein